jgi:quercetin 2,3-dioxygenase
MSIRVIPKERQGQGQFNGGQIVENKPVGFPRDGSEIRPFSNLFYWAHARAVADSTIGLHPHQGFEICSFILKGPVRHYDTKAQTWVPLEAGDVQIIRSGSGISHAEFMGESSEMFQIWFDPNLELTLSQSATYDDYRAISFPKKETAGITHTTLVGGDSPFRMVSEGVEVDRIDLASACHDLPIGDGRVAAVYVLEGEVLLQDQLARPSDFALIEETDVLRIEALAEASVFVMRLPRQVNYPTYAASARH